MGKKGKKKKTPKVHSGKKVKNEKPRSRGKRKNKKQKKVKIYEFQQVTSEVYSRIEFSKTLISRKLISMMKKLQQTLDAFEKKQQDVRGNLKKLESTKKDKDAKPIMETLYDQLKETIQLYEQAGKEINTVQDEIGKKLGKKEEKVQPEREKESPVRKTPLSPDEMELTYELKAQLMRNVEMQNHKLKTELTLHEKMTESKIISQQHKKLLEEQSMSRTNTLRLMKMFEKKAREEMQHELSKSQQLTKKYHQLLELEKRKMGGSRSGHVTPLSMDRDTDDESPKLPPSSTYTMLGNSVRVNDVLLEENEKLRGEIQRLKQDNAILIKKAKHAMSDKDEIIHRLETSEANRKDLTKRLSREKTQYSMLSKSLTRQASDWILLKKQLAQFDEEYRWSQVGVRRTPKTPTSHWGGHSYLPSRISNRISHRDKASAHGDWSSVYRTPREKSVAEWSLASTKPPKELNLLNDYVKNNRPRREKSKLLPII
ncbi:hypothetical protein FSP39_000942 [Pinctada imbricata]|uniref:Uncharacterized protein n=1 Tax=Pinctada imbricata TaxID=66713 RepID=A0AA89C0B6_PINIB|nr:hypothetical protein FSP39_000942 [Pinctada imbricata]